MSKHECRIAAGDWFGNNMKRVGIYNADYYGNFQRRSRSAKPWMIAAQSSSIHGYRFATHEEAATFVREHLDTLTPQVSE